MKLVELLDVIADCEQVRVEFFKYDAKTNTSDKKTIAFGNAEGLKELFTRDSNYLPLDWEVLLVGSNKGEIVITLHKKIKVSSKCIKRGHPICE